MLMITLLIKQHFYRGFCPNKTTGHLHRFNNSDTLLHRWLVIIRSVYLLSLGSRVRADVTVHFHQTTNLELRLLQDLHFANINVL
uniref:Uncharacterized protein n=1 Tax=Parascaris univalens TaxID=6257 RepID=A0A915BJT0_PARUN